MVVKFSVYLNRHVFVMSCIHLQLLANKSKLFVHWWQFSAKVREYPQTNLMLSFGTIKVAVYAYILLLYACS